MAALILGLLQMGIAGVALSGALILAHGPGERRSGQKHDDKTAKLRRRT